MKLKTLVLAATAALSVGCATQQETVVSKHYQAAQGIDSMFERMHSNPSQLTQLVPVKEEISYPDHQPTVDAVTQKYYGLDPASRTLYLLEDVINLHIDLTKIQEELKQPSNARGARRRHSSATKTQIQYVDKPITQADVQEYLTKHDLKTLPVGEFTQLTEYVAYLENNTDIDAYKQQTSMYRQKIQQLQSVVDAQRTQYTQLEAQKQAIIENLLTEIDELERRPPIQQELQQEVYMKQEELPNGALNLKLHNTTLVFPTVQYLCAPKPDSTLACMDMRDILKNATDHQ